MALGRRSDLGQDLDVVVAFEQRAKALPDDDVVVHQQHGDAPVPHPPAPSSAAIGTTSLTLS